MMVDIAGTDIRNVYIRARYESQAAKKRKVTTKLLTPELNPSAQRCLIRFIIGDFAS
jgi:hypothetical protein